MTWLPVFEQSSVASHFAVVVFFIRCEPFLKESSPSRHRTGTVLTGKVNVDESSSVAGKSTSAEAASSIAFSSCADEFVAMTLFVILGPGSAIDIAKTEGYLGEFMMTSCLSLPCCERQ